MKKMILFAVIIQLFAGCITIKDTNWEENRQVTSFAGPGSKDSKLVKWKKCERDSGKRVSVGFFPGGAEVLKAGCMDGLNTGFLEYFSITSYANVFGLGVPTLYSLFGGGFSDDSDYRSGTSLGIIGAYEWKDMKVAKTNVVKFANCEEVIERHLIYTPEKNISPTGKTGDSVPLFFDYPGFNALFEKVKECGAVAVMHDEGSYSYRLFRRSKYVDGTMVYKDVDLGRDKIADEQIDHQRAVRKMRTAMNALRKHRGFPFADKNLKKDFSDHLIKIDNEFKLSLSSSSSALKYLENRMMELKKGFEKAYQDEVARVRKLEVERIAENVKKIEKLIAVENFNEVLKICEGELHQTKPGAKQEDARIWEKYKDKVKKCQVAKKVKKIEGLLKSGSFNEVLKICEGELHPIKPGANQEDVRIWEKYKERAEKELLAKKIREIEGLLKSGSFIEALKICEGELHQTEPGVKHEDARIWEKYKERAQKGQKDKNRAAELARLAELKKKLEQLTSEEKWDEIITICTAEQQNYLSSECSLPGDQLVLDDFFANAHKKLDKMRMKEKMIRMKEKRKTLEEEGGQLTKIECFDSEIELGEKLVAWIKQKSNQTSLQRESTFKEYCNRRVLFKGTVEDIGKPFETLWGEKTIYVSLNVEKSGLFSGVDIKFLIDSSLRDQALKWNKGDCVILRGLVSSQGDLLNDLTIRYAVPVSDEEYDRSLRTINRIADINRELDSIKWELERLREEKGGVSFESIEGLSISLFEEIRFEKTSIDGESAYIACKSNGSNVNIVFKPVPLPMKATLVPMKLYVDMFISVRKYSGWEVKGVHISQDQTQAIVTCKKESLNQCQKWICDLKNRRFACVTGTWLEGFDEDAEKIRECLDSANL